MKIAYLTAGAAGMFCGSCMHDNALAAALNRAGVDCQLIPTYTPIRTDETDVSVDQVFFGGINVYLQQKVPLFRHVPRFLDRFLDSPWLIRRVTRRASHIDPKDLGALTVSMLKGRSGFQRKEVARLARWLEHHHRPDVIVLTNMLIAGGVPDLKAALQVPVVVTLQGDDIFLDSLPEPHRSQAFVELRRLVPHVDAFLVHSRFYADAMGDYLGIPRDRFRVTPLGLDTRDFQARSADRASGGDLTIGYLARLAPEKGLHRLVDACLALQERGRSGWRLRIAGWLGDSQRTFAETQFRRLDQAGLQDRYVYEGSVDRHRKVDFLGGLDLLCVPTTYREPKGLFALEAMAAGVPVLLPDHGAFGEMVADTGGGRLFDPDDPESLVHELERILDDPSPLPTLGAAGREAVLTRRDGRSMAQSTLDVLNEVVAGFRAGTDR